MPEAPTTPADASGEAGTNQADWPAKYAGSQIALNRKHEALTAAEKRATEATERASALEAELDAFRARDAAANEDQQAQALYESLRDRFEPEPPTPRGTAAAREPRSASEPEPFGYSPTSEAFPTS